MIRFHKRILLCTTADIRWLGAQIVIAREARRQFIRMADVETLLRSQIDDSLESM